MFMKINKVFLLLFASISLVSCHKSLEDRAAKDCKEFTEKNCPTPLENNTRMDSMVYEPATHTIHYYHSFFNEADNKSVIDAHTATLRKTLLDAVKADMGTKIYKEAGFNFRYTYHSSKTPQQILLDFTFTKDEY